MAEKEPGILRRDGVYFYQASDFARKNLHYIHWGAKYSCDVPYRVDRDYLDSFLLFFVLRGTLAFEYRGAAADAGERECALLDCKHKNVYYAKGQAEFLWFHFSGGVTQQLVDELYELSGFIFSKSFAPAVEPMFNEIMAMLKSGESNDYAASRCIHSLLCSLFAPKGRCAGPVEEAAAYMKLNLSRQLYVDEICARVNLSLYHFTRLFKSQTGLSPHEYLLGLRLLEAKKLLSASDFPVEDVAAKCGFNSASHFIRAFQKSVGLTPLKFRKMKL